MRFSRAGRVLGAICFDGMAHVWDFDANESRAFVLGGGAPMGIAILDSAASLAITTTARLVVFDMRAALAAPANLDEIHAAVRRSVTEYQRLRRADADERMLFDAERPE